MVLEGARITLKEISEVDLDFVRRIESDTELWSFSEDVLTDPEELKRIIMHRITSDDSHDFIISKKENAGIPVGEVRTCSQKRRRTE